MEERKEEQKNVPTLRPKNKVASFISLFIADDLDAVRSHIVHDIIVPSVKDVLVNSFASFINGAGYRRKANWWNSSGYSNYSGNNWRNPNSVSHEISVNSLAKVAETPQLMDFQRIIFDSADSVIAVLDALDDEASRGPYVSVASIFEYAHMKVPTPTFYDYGWPSEQISMAKYKMNLVEGTYYIHGLPRPINIKK